MSTYHEAGVDLDAAAHHVGSIAADVMATWTPDVVGTFGGFAAGVRVPAGFHEPVLMMSTDGVGTKLELARQMDCWDTVGFDLVAMCVDDLVAAGAKPIGFSDYLAVGRLEARRDRRIVASIAKACSAAGVSLLGGETAEHPGVMAAGQVDVAGTAIGVVELGKELTGQAIEPGHVVIGLESPNVRSNGFSLVRSIVPDISVPFLGRTLGDILLEPSVIYAPDVHPVIGMLTGVAHITGGGIVENLLRILPAGRRVAIDPASWHRPAIFGELARLGAIGESEMFRVFNMGIGMILIAAPSNADSVLEAVHEHNPTVLGLVEAGARSVALSDIS